MKQFVSKLAALGMTVTLFASAAGALSVSAATSMCGDVNCDGSISMADVVLLNKYCSGNVTEQDEYVGGYDCWSKWWSSICNNKV